MLLKLATCKQTLIKDNRTAISNPDIIRTHVITLKTTQTYIVLLKNHDNMLASCRLHVGYADGHESPSVQVIFYLWAVRCLPQNTPGGSYTFTGEDGPGCRGGGLQLGWCPRFSFLHRVFAVRWKLTLLLHCSSSRSSTCSERLTHFLHLSLTLSIPQLSLQTHWRSPRSVWIHRVLNRLS